MSKQVLVTVHGVNPDRQWQQRIREVMGPHFDCKGITYNEYDSSLGTVRVVVNIPVFVMSLVLFIFAVLGLATRYWLTAMILLVVAAIFFALSLLFAWNTRVKGAKSLKLAIENECAFGRPHVVAHSLGTYLVGNVLRKFPDIRLGNVVLVSSVLPRQYPWQKILIRPTCVGNVRNEFGTADFLVK